MKISQIPHADTLYNESIRLRRFFMLRIRKALNFSRLALYLSLFLAALCLFFVGDNGEPLPLLLAYAMMSAGLPALPAMLIGFLPAVFSFSLPLILVYLIQNILLAVGFFLHIRYARGKAPVPFLPLLFLSVALAIFALAAPFTPYPLPWQNSFLATEIAQKVLLVASLFLLAAVFSVAMKALLRKFLRCRLRSDEILFILLFLVLVGVGICQLLSVNAYLGIAFFVLLVFSCITKDASSLACAFCLALPPLLTIGQSPEQFFFLGIVVLLFIRYGRLATATAFMAAFLVYGYFQGLYTYPTASLVPALLSALLPALFFVLFPSPVLKSFENKLIFYREKHLSRIAINRNRAAVGEKLFELSAVFREIQATFQSLGAEEAEAHAKEYVCTCLVDEVCKKCPQYPLCARKNPLPWIQNLVEIGCIKGKVSLIDVPKSLSDLCGYQSELLYALNRHLAEYKAYASEAENTATGRSLLAGQAQGVSEILKNLALEQSQPLKLYTDKERALNIALLGAGIVCLEVLIYGDEENLTLSLITFGNADVQKITAVASHLFGEDMVISERLALSQDRFCCILRKKPFFDAAFGVSNVKKTGERTSGDTHSVIKIDERRFMVALVDGMGSGDYAQKISAGTISLLESFYRAKMPPALVLSTINKLLTFSKEERFACVDVAIVDLDLGSADVVKIGSPLAFILSGNTVKVLESSSLPLGILDSLRPDVSTYSLHENDVLLFVSDGVTDAFGSATDLYEVLRSLPTNNPQQLAEGLTQSALRAYGGKAKDDITAVAVRLYKAKN